LSCWHSRIKIVTVHGIYIYEILLYEKMDLTRFRTNSVLYSYETRNKSDLFITDLNTKLFAQCIAYNSVLIYNNISHEMKSITCILKFKIIIFNFLLERFLFCGRIDCRSLICRNCVNDVCYIVTIWALHPNAAFD